MSLFLHIILFNENFNNYVKETSPFSMLEAKLLYNKT